MENDDLPAVEPVSLALTRPPTKWGVRYEIFALNGMVAVVVFIASGSFVIPLVSAFVIHLAAMYLCQRDPFIFHIIERLLSMRRAVRNVKFWGARSYSP
jgi:type IV secretion system protein VirB3